MDKKRKVKVLQALGGGGYFGGVEAFLYQHCSKFNRESLDFDFLFCSKNSLGSRLNSATMQKSNFYALDIIDYVHKIRNFTSGYYFLHKELKRFLKNKHYDIIHMHTGSVIIQAIFASIIGKLPGTMFIPHSHGYYPRSIFIEKLLYNPLRESIVKNSDYLFACSVYAGKGLFGNNTGFKVIPNSIDLNKFCLDMQKRMTMRDVLGVEQYFVVGTVGRLVPIKNQLFLLKIFAQLQRKHTKSKLLIVGDGQLRQTLERQAEKLGIKEAVIFTGSRTNTEDYYQAMDVFVLPSFSEGLSIVTLEAQATGLPCLVSTGVPAEVDVGAGLVVRMDLSAGESAWAEELLLLRGRVRTDGSLFLRQAGYDIADTAAWLEDFYIRVASGERVHFR